MTFISINKTMDNLLKIRSAIYDQFHGSSAGPAHFFQPENEDAYAAYYTSMYLIQDTGEAVWTHMKNNFSPDPMRAYLEFWGVMQAIFVQQDAIDQLHHAVIGKAPNKRPKRPAWMELRKVRNKCAGHPANREYKVPAPQGKILAWQRTFMGRSFGNYNCIRYTTWDTHTRQKTHHKFNLRQMVDDYDVEASAILDEVLSNMKSRWPLKRR